MNYTQELQVKNATELQQLLDSKLTEINEHEEAGDSTLFDRLHDDFALTITAYDKTFELSLGSMDTYSAFCRFLEQIKQSE